MLSARLPGGCKSVLEEQPNMKVMFYRLIASVLTCTAPQRHEESLLYLQHPIVNFPFNVCTWTLDGTT